MLGKYNILLEGILILYPYYTSKASIKNHPDGASNGDAH